MKRIAIITGASAGIGLACAEKFLQQGFEVFNLSRRPTNNDGIRDFCCNLAWESQLADTLDQLLVALGQGGQISLVHNAARMDNDSAANSDNDYLKLGFAIQIMAPAMINRTLIPLMGAGSSIIYIGSTLSEKAAANAFSYTTLKHAVAGMMRATSQDLAGSGIHSACICPGFTDTVMLQQRLKDNPQLASFARDNAGRRLIDTAEIAECVSWAHHNPVINGALIHANLGQRQQ